MSPVLGCFSLCQCPKSWAGWRTAGLDPLVSAASRNKGVLGIRSSLLPGLWWSRASSCPPASSQVDRFAAGRRRGGGQLQVCQAYGGCSFDILVCQNEILPGARLPPEEAVEDPGMSCSSQGACCPACPCLALWGGLRQHCVPSNLHSSTSGQSRIFKFWLLSHAWICVRPPGQEGRKSFFCKKIFGVSCSSHELFPGSAGTQRPVPHPAAAGAARGALCVAHRCQPVLYPLTPAPRLLYSNHGLNRTAQLLFVANFLI